jgi:hypothetical protein
MAHGRPGNENSVGSNKIKGNNDKDLLKKSRLQVRDCRIGGRRANNVDNSQKNKSVTFYHFSVIHYARLIAQRRREYRSTFISLNGLSRMTQGLAYHHLATGRLGLVFLLLPVAHTGCHTP